MTWVKSLWPGICHHYKHVTVAFTCYSSPVSFLRVKGSTPQSVRWVQKTPQNWGLRLLYDTAQRNPTMNAVLILNSQKFLGISQDLYFENIFG